VYLPEELEIEENAYWKVTYTQQGLGYFVEVATYDEVRELIDELENDGATGASVEGPFFSDKELSEGLTPARSLFDRLKGD
jgi:hypothetical protein